MYDRMLHIQLLRVELLGAGSTALLLPPDTAQLCWQLHTCWTHHPCSLPGLKLSPTEFTDMSCCPHQHHPDSSLQHLRWALATLPEPWFPMLTFEISEIKVLTLCFPEVSHLNCCVFLQPSKVGKVAVSFVRLLTAQHWEGLSRPCPAPSQVQAIPASSAELFQLCSQFLSRPWAQPAQNMQCYEN